MPDEIPALYATFNYETGRLEYKPLADIRQLPPDQTYIIMTVTDFMSHRLEAEGLERMLRNNIPEDE